MGKLIIQWFVFFIHCFKYRGTFHYLQRTGHLHQWMMVLAWYLYRPKLKLPLSCIDLDNLLLYQIRWKLEGAWEKKTEEISGWNESPCTYDSPTWERTSPRRYNCSAGFGRPFGRHSVNAIPNISRTLAALTYLPHMYVYWSITTTGSIVGQLPTIFSNMIE